jgi:hypothetical protein
MSIPPNVYYLVEHNPYNAKEAYIAPHDSQVAQDASSVMNELCNLYQKENKFTIQSNAYDVKEANGKERLKTIASTVFVQYETNYQQKLNKCGFFSKYITLIRDYFGLTTHSKLVKLYQETFHISRPEISHLMQNLHDRSEETLIDALSAVAARCNKLIDELNRKDGSQFGESYRVENARSNLHHTNNVFYNELQGLKDPASRINYLKQMHGVYTEMANELKKMIG